MDFGSVEYLAFTAPECEKDSAKRSFGVKIKFSSLSAPTKIEELTAGSDEKTQRIFVGVEREENLIRNDPDESEFTITVF